MPERFGLYLVLTEPLAGYEACAEAAVSAGVRYLQLRMKDRPRTEVIAVARRLRAITRSTATRFIVNDDVAAAAEVDADGVHLGQEDLALAEARRLWPEPGKIFGLSTHSEAQERAARAQRPDYVGVGPVFATPTKARPDPLPGPARACAIVRGSPLTAVAIGGLDRHNLDPLLRQGVANFAVVRAVGARPDPGRAIAELMDLWRVCQAGRSGAGDVTGTRDPG